MKNKILRTISTMPVYRIITLKVLLLVESVVFYYPPVQDFQTWAIVQVFLIMGIIIAAAAFLAGMVVWVHDRPYKLKHVFDDANILD